MRNLVNLLIKYHAFILFLFFEVGSIALVVTQNSHQQSVFVNLMLESSGRVYATYSGLTDYLHLKTVNQHLLEENARLREIIQNRQEDYTPGDSAAFTGFKPGSDYRFIPAKVINNSTHHANNYITLNRGLNDSIRPNMGVITHQGTVGIINRVSPNFSTAVSLLNTDARVSAMLKHQGKPGTVMWDGKNIHKLLLTGIPVYIPVKKGDSIVTSGYSTIFPPGVLIGTVSDFYRIPGDNYYTIELKPAVDFERLQIVYIIDNLKAEERLQLERKNL